MVNEDEWPKRNLGSAEHWGRVIEQATDYLESQVDIAGENIGGTNRATAASAQDISKLIQDAIELALDVEEALLISPRYFVRTASKTRYAVGTGWNTVCSISVPAVSGFTNGEVRATGTIYTEQDVTPTGSAFEWPFDLSTVSSEFGPRPPLPYHNGIDFAVSTGTPIPSSSAGTVIVNQYYDDYGNYLRVDVSDATGVDGSWLGYAHMQFPSTLPVGTVVTQGQTLGLVGTTGFSTGPHLHWETAPGGTRIDPRMFMDIFGGAGGSSDPLEVQARIVINGSASPVFHPYTEVGIGPKQQNFPIFGRSVSSLKIQDSISVSLQVRSVGGKIPVRNSQQATLSIQGGFRK